MPAPRSYNGNHHGVVNVLERIERHAGELRDDECWTTDYTPNPQGGIQVRVTADQPKVYLHRIAWEAHNAEPVPDGMLVLHTCNNPQCFNPEIYHWRPST